VDPGMPWRGLSPLARIMRVWGLSPFYQTYIRLDKLFSMHLPMGEER